MKRNIINAIVRAKSIFRIHKHTVPQAKYVDLAPTNKADEAGIYYEAIAEALNERFHPDVYNIALTGPYGSGKSSVIKSFLEKYKGSPPLQISLASFLPEQGGEAVADVEAESSEENSNQKESIPKLTSISKQEIERSILQQMLYGADANSLPLSRFKRIQTPQWWSRFKSLFIVLGFLSLWYLFLNRSEILSGQLFLPFDLTNWFNISCAAFGFIFLWQVLHQIYLKSYGLALKSVSLKDIEITPETAQEESILNRHLDEIIYFFQSTNYDLVIIEDLDRFDKPDIFVTLREINSLINTNAGVKRKVRFLYALRDDMFVNTDRTKFFEFIIPVIPIINHSNSIDKVLEQGQRLDLGERLDHQFLREVSRYLNDLRLIRNIFNEFALYIANLGTVLDANKLLAVLIYKNVMPRDFEQLHHQKGVLAEILGRYDEYISNAKSQYLAQISEIEEEIALAERREPWELEELRKVYAMAAIEKMHNDHTIVVYNNAQINVRNLSEHENFEEIIQASNLRTRSPQGGWMNLDLSSLQEKVNPDMTYSERVADIQRKSESFKEDAARKIRTLRTKISNLHKEKFHEVLRKNTAQIDGCLETLDDRRDLLKYLILEGYLDDTYYQYISLFHKGRLSPSDNKFLIQIRSFNTPEPSHQISNAAEVTAEMRPEDFEQSYVLNVDLIDYLLENSNDNQERLDKATRFISRNFDSCDSFFNNYYSNGKHISDLVNKLAETWNGFIPAAIKKGNAAEHIANIIAHIPSGALAENCNEDRLLSDYLSKNLAQVLEHQGEIDLMILENLDIKLEEIISIESHEKVLQSAIENQQFAITARNMRFVLERMLDQVNYKNIGLKQYSVILSLGQDWLIEYVENNFDVYLQNVLLITATNTQEEHDAIRRALALEGVPKELLEKFLIKQEAVFETLDQIPIAFHTPLFENQKVQASWGNILEYIDNDDHDPAILTAFMKHAENKNALLATRYQHGEETKPLNQFIVNNNDFSDNEYREYVQAMPVYFYHFPEEISDSRKLILINEKKVRLHQSSYGEVKEDEQKLLLLLAKNMDIYLNNKAKYDINDAIRVGLLKANIPQNEKLEVALDVHADTVIGDNNSAAIIGPIIDQSETNFENLGYEYIKSIVINSSAIKVQISLLNKYHGELSVDEIKGIIRELPSPFNDIVELWKMPAIPNTPENRQFADWLEADGIISSTKLIWGDRDIRINTFRKAEDAADTDGVTG